MAMRVSRANDMALTVSADHLIGRYDLAAVGRVFYLPSLSDLAILRPAMCPPILPALPIGQNTRETHPLPSVTTAGCVLLVDGMASTYDHSCPRP
jgi:hypothetical protein